MSSSADWEFYKLCFEQMDAVRAAHRDTRRFHITLNITGVSTLLGLYGQFGQNGAVLVASASFGLALMCIVWFTTSDYYGKRFVQKGEAVLRAEEKLGLTYFADELWLLHKQKTPFAFPLDRLSAALLGVAYALAAAFFAWQAATSDASSLGDWMRLLKARLG
jgi:hypothetical protein